jgi:hypothetical protein
MTYTQWKTLNIKTSGLERDPITGCIEATDEWWEEQNAVSAKKHFVYNTSFVI